jgi:hypothetical protein
VSMHVHMHADGAAWRGLKACTETWQLASRAPPRSGRGGQMWCDYWPGSRPSRQFGEDEKRPNDAYQLFTVSLLRNMPL